MDCCSVGADVFGEITVGIRDRVGGFGWFL